jgi:hypothetical protein
MELQTATAITNLMLGVSAQLDASVQLVLNDSDQGEVDAYKLSVGNLLGQIYCEILTPIFKQYPQLAPDQLSAAGERKRET